MTEIEGRKRVMIEGVQPEIDHGRFPIKRTVGEKVLVEADVFADSHDSIACLLLYRREEESNWQETPMGPGLNDRWQGVFRVIDLGSYRYTLLAWIDHFMSWRRDLEKKMIAGQAVAVDLIKGALWLKEAGQRASGRDKKRLLEISAFLRSSVDESSKIALALDKEVKDLVAQYQDRKLASRYPKELEVIVERERARFSAWYEMFPRSASAEPGRHGSFKDCEARLPYIAAMGFDVLYFPPIHPIGKTHRKGKNNTPQAGPDDPGSPWAIGNETGGHTAIHRRLGTFEEFQWLLERARDYGIEVALDLAFQCSPDHPFVKEHPEWFSLRPDGSIQYAENPPKKYEDIYPLNFETENWLELWEALKSIVLFWIDQGIRIFRVDNPHTKPYRFWEWLIREIKNQYPETIFLAEAFTRPKMMAHLARLGFSQSYTYFTWRNTKWEIEGYLNQINRTETGEYFRGNLWPNTPDILTEHLQFGGRPAFISRLVLAATLGANYGIYGPAFELLENQPLEMGGEEYLHSEKYEIRCWNLDRPENLKDFIGRVNRIRKENPALQNDWSLQFHPVDNDQLLCYSKHSEDLNNIIIVVVNLDPHHNQTGWVRIALEDLRIDRENTYQVHDLLSDARYLWYGEKNYLELNPQVVPAQIFRIRRKLRTERDFDYFI